MVRAASCRWCSGRSGRVCLLACVCLTAQGSEVAYEWVFDSQHVRDGRVAAAAGGWDGTLLGKLSLSRDPESLLFAGDLKSRLAVEIAADGTRIPLPRRELTAEAWVSVDRPQDSGAFVSAFQDNGSYEKGWLLGFQKDRFCFAVSTRQAQPSRLTYLAARTEFQPGCWYYVAGTYDGTEQRIYVDGRLMASSREQSGDIDYPPRFVFTLGAYRDDDEWYPLAGRLARVRVADRVLSAAEIAARFQSLKAGFPDIEPSVSPVADWPTYLRDARRTGLSGEPLAFPLQLKWTHRTAQGASAGVGGGSQGRLLSQSLGNRRAGGVRSGLPPGGVRRAAVLRFVRGRPAGVPGRRTGTRTAGAS